MKQFSVLAIAAMLLAAPSFATAEELKSGLQSGDAIGAFNVTKICGAESDGVEAGKNLCYRCKNGSRPQVMVFTRSSDGKVVELVRSLDQAVAKKEQLRAFVNVMSDSKDAAAEEVTKLATASKAENIPFVVPNEFENGPEDYGINAKAEVTVILASKGVVKSSFAAASAKDLDVKAVVESLNELTN